MEIFTSAARKAQVAALVGFLTPLGTYVVSEMDWSWRAFAGAVITGLITGLSVYGIPNAPTTVTARARRSGRHARQEDS